MMLSQPLLNSNLETIRDAEGHTLFSHVAGKVVVLCKCTPMIVGVRHDGKACCMELPVWSGYDLSTPAFMEATSRKLTYSCTPRVCNTFNLPFFNIGSRDHPKWVQVGRTGDIIEAKDPQEFSPISSNKADQIVLEQAGIYSK